MGAFVDWPTVLASISARGFAVAAVSYRFSSEAASPAAIQDVKAAIRWMRVNATKYHLDPARAMTWGQSAGGQLAALAAVSCGVKALDPPARSTPNAPNVEVRASAPKGADEVSDSVQGALGW
jgi:acetyl esterase/lipase